MQSDIFDTRLLCLLAEQACRDLVVRAARFTDSRAYDDLARLFTEDGVLLRPGGAPLQGRDAIVASYRSRPAERLSRHLICNSLVHLETDTTARGTSSVLLWSGLRTDEPTAWGRPAQPLEVLGEFEDVFSLTSAGWRISRREASFVLFRGNGQGGRRPRISGGKPVNQR